jgi:hypothetical protein
VTNGGGPAQHHGRTVQFSLTNRTLLSAQLDGSLQTLASPWAQATNLHLTTVTAPASDATGTSLKTTLKLDADQIASRLVQTQTNHLTAEVLHSLTNFTAIDGHWQLAIEQLATEWGQTEQVHLTGRVPVRTGRRPARPA